MADQAGEHVGQDARATHALHRFDIHCCKGDEMKSLFRFAALTAAGCSVSIMALAGNNLPGTYEGKIKEVTGYPGQAGDPCVVKIGTADNYGGSTTFSINGVEPILFENIHIDKQLDNQKKAIKLHSPGSPTKDVEVVFMRMGENSLPTYIKMFRKNSLLHQEKSIDCDGLTRK